VKIKRFIQPAGFVALLLYVIPAAHADWTFSSLASVTPTATATAIDSAGNVHVAYIAGPNLYYARRTGQAWSTPSAVEQPVAPGGVAIAVDSSGRPHISFYGRSAARYVAKHAYNNGSGWTVTSVSETFSTSSLTSGISHVVFDTYSAHVVYNNNATSSVGRADFNGSSWTQTTLASGGVAAPSSVAVARDGNGRLHTLYQSPAGLQYIPPGGTPTLVDTGGAYCALAVDTTGTLHAVYQGSTGNNLWYRSKPSAGGWSGATRISSASGGYASIATDEANRVHISYYDSGSLDLMYATNAGGNFTGTAVDSAGDVGRASSIAVSPGRIVISYTNTTGSQAKVAIIEFPLAKPVEAYVNFGSVVPGDAAAHTVTVRNAGAADMIVGSTGSTDADASLFHITSDNCTGYSIPVNGSCTVTVSFSPLSGGSRSANLVITSNDPYSPARVGLQGSAPDMYLVRASAEAGGTISPSGPIAVTSGAGSPSFTITASPGFTVWDVIIDGTTSLGAVGSHTFTNVTAPHTINATFVSPFRVYGLPSFYYGTAQETYAAASDGDSIQTRAVYVSGDLLANRNISVQWKGGYDTPFAAQTGVTQLLDNLIISDGTVVVENVELR
jgi:hypothetical protein